jgi:hypothetical protein
MKSTLRSSLLVLLALVLIGSLAPAAEARNCPRFIVGKANSAAYDHHRLPARKAKVNRVSCKRMRKLARAFHSGELTLSGRDNGPGRWRGAFPIEYDGLAWTCRYIWLGGSGPTYNVACRKGSRRARWNVG